MNHFVHSRSIDEQTTNKTLLSYSRTKNYLHTNIYSTNRKFITTQYPLGKDIEYFIVDKF